MDINQVMEVGRLTRDPEIITTKSGKPLCKFSIAVNGRTKEEVSFFDVACWNKTAENCNKYLSKGKRIGIVGSLNQNRWKAEDGTVRSKISINAITVQFLEPMQNSEQPGEQKDDSPENFDFFGTPQDSNDGVPFE